MKFMLMMNCPRNVEEVLRTWPAAAFQKHIEFMIAFAAKLRGSGELVLAEGLDMPTAARIVKAQKHGPVTVTDGPFAETKEFLAGFWIVDVASRERAIAIAGEASAAPGPDGTPMGIPIELRQVMAAPAG